MEQKNRLIITATVIVLIVGAIIASFALNFFAVDTPHVQLPTVDPAGGDSSASVPPTEVGQYQTVAVTPDTVQGVIATLSRLDSYYRELTVETFWTGGSYAAPVQVWTDGGWSHTRQTLASGAVRHDLVGEGVLYYWYDGSRQYESAPADDFSSDLAQRVPTYETVLALDPDSITAAGYELRGGIPCVLAQVDLGDGLVERYWVGVDSGLLVSAEMEQDGELVYRMTAYGAVTAPCPAGASFELPDGTELHTLA